MPCSCGNTMCPCGIPCYCSNESCTCQTCSLVAPSLCGICNKRLTIEKQENENEDLCSCFIGDSSVVLQENTDDYHCQTSTQLGPTGYYVSGTLMIPVIVPVPAPGIQYHFTARQPINLVPVPPSIRDEPRKMSNSSDKKANIPFHLRSDPNYFSTENHFRFLDESSGLSGYNASSEDSSDSSEKTADIACQKQTFSTFKIFRPADKPNIKTSHDTSSDSEKSNNVQERTSPRESSFAIGTVDLSDPVWGLPDPASETTGSPDSSLKYYNPFYTIGPIHPEKAAAAYEKVYHKPAPWLSKTNLNCMPVDERKVEVKMVTASRNRQKSINTTEISEQSIMANFGKDTTSAYSSNVAANTENTVSFGTFNSNFLSNQPVTSVKCLIPDAKPLAFLTKLSSSNVCQLSGVPVQPPCAIPNSTFQKHGNLQTYLATNNSANSLKIQPLNDSQKSKTKVPKERNELFPFPELQIPTPSTSQKPKPNVLKERNELFPLPELQMPTPSTSQFMMDQFGFPTSSDLLKLLNASSRVNSQQSNCLQKRSTFAFSTIDQRHEGNPNLLKFTGQPTV